MNYIEMCQLMRVLLKRIWEKEITALSRIKVNSNSSDLVVTSLPLTKTERTLFASAYYRAISESHQQWSKLEQVLKGHPSILASLTKVQIEGEIKSLCDDAIALLNAGLLNSTESESPDIEAEVTYLKMNADVHRYLAEIFAGLPRGDSAIKIGKAGYIAAFAKVQMLPDYSTSPLYLDLVLSRAVFLYDLCSERSEAVKLVESVLVEANKLFVYADDAYHSQVN
jgi:hypothetical protein